MPLPRLAAIVAAAAVAGAACLTGCGASDGRGGGDAGSGQADPLRVVAAFYPLQYVADRVAGTAATVTNLTKPGAEPHDLELSPRQVGAVSKADLVVYERGFQPAVDDAVAQEAHGRALDVATIATLRDGEGADPHIWLDPTRMQRIANAVALRLAQLRPAQESDIAARAKRLDLDLTALDGELRSGLAHCAR